MDAQNGIDMVGVAGLLEGARSSVIEARKARHVQLLLRRRVVYVAVAAAQALKLRSGPAARA